MNTLLFALLIVTGMIALDLIALVVLLSLRPEIRPFVKYLVYRNQLDLMNLLNLLIPDLKYVQEEEYDCEDELCECCADESSNIPNAMKEQE